MISEERRLQTTLQLIERNIAELEERVQSVKAETEALNDKITPRDRELNTQLSVQLTISTAMLTHVRAMLRKNTAAKKSPYFGRIDYREVKSGSKESFYIGKNGIMDGQAISVVDWRAPVAKVYYENEKGPGSYEVPEGDPVGIDLSLKRTFDIENGILRGFYDSDVASNDELLVKYLAKHKELVLSDIIATIQKEQDAIIRLSPYTNILVQGVAGSGKTTVALHRISHILYNYSHRYEAKDFCIIGGTDVLLRYIASGLPDLDVENVPQRRMDAFFREELFEDFLEDFEVVPAAPEESFKARLSFAQNLDKYLEKAWLRLLRPRAVTDKDLGDLLTRDQVYDLLNYRRDWSLLRIRTLLNETLMGRIELLTDVVTDDERTRKEHLLQRAAKKRAFENYYAFEDKWNDVVRIYEDFLSDYGQMLAKGELSYLAPGETVSEKHIEAAKGKIARKKFSVYDLAALCLIRRYFTEDLPVKPYGQIVIDEAQDFGESIYYILKRMEKGCYFTIMGDVSQNVHFETGQNDWKAMREEIFSGEEDRFFALQKSYRNTIEISEFAGKILRSLGELSGQTEAYRIEPVIRHGDPVREIFLSEEAAERGQSAEALLKEWVREAKEKDYHTAAVICRSGEDAEEALRLLGGEESVRGSGEEDFALSILSVDSVKGLEFDAVCLYKAGEDRYPNTPRDLKLLYVAATRALHELLIMK